MAIDGKISVGQKLLLVIYEKWGGLRQAEAVFGGLARASFLGALSYGVWAYGATRDETMTVFAVLLYGSGGLWLVELLLRRRIPRMAAVPLICTVLLLGFSGACLATGVYLEANWNEDIPEWCENFLSAITPWDNALAAQALFRNGALLLAFLMLLETLREPVWRRIALCTVGLLGFSIACFGVLQFTIGAPFQWVAIDGRTPLHFAVYRYHGNAAAFLNLTWPALAAIAVLAIRRLNSKSQNTAWQHAEAVFWSLAMLTTFGTCFLNTSKAGNGLAILGAALFGAMTVAAMRRKLPSTLSSRHGVQSVAVLVALVIMAVSFAFLMPWDRWQKLVTEGADREGRLHAYSLFLNAAKDAGWMGAGPGCFENVYPQYVPDGDPIKHLGYDKAHQDYIQTVVEWGWLGACLWLILLGGGALGLLRKALRSAHNRSEIPPRLIDLGFKAVEIPALRKDSSEMRWIGIAGVASVIMTSLHSMVDFPMQIMSLQMLFLFWIALGYQTRRE